ncbi:MAG TPA: VWA domain-containing protein [Edaphobacter sp.]|nr:VWA domain-containing protein [Edaphobacter sp.]
MEHLRRARALVSGLFLAFAIPLAAQETPAPKPASSPTTIAVDARLVNLPVVVRDKKGALVQNLTKDDFTLQVDGHPQTIRYFDIDANLPLTLGLLVDTSLSQRDVIDEERTASGIFLDQMLKTPKDQAFIVQFARQTELLQDLTNSRPKLQAALKEIDTPSPSNQSTTGSDDSDGSNSGGHRGHGGGTVLYDAAFLASDELMSKQKGRKALIILSDGVDNGSKETLVSAIEAAQRADTIVYAIYFKGEEPHNESNRGGGRQGGIGYPGGRGGGYPGGGGGYPGGRGGGNPGSRGNTPHVDGKKVLERMAQETGGRLFEVSKKQTVGQIYTQIAEELRAQYRLGYTPDQATAADGFHQIDLTTRRKDLIVQTRDGYYTGK